MYEYIQNLSPLPKTKNECSVIGPNIFLFFECILFEEGSGSLMYID